MPSIDLNVDLGELPDEPAELFALATTANIACGGHAGDEATMDRSVARALAHGTRLAAHPSYPDREGFGRTTLPMEPAALGASVEAQCAALAAVAARRGARITRVKPHGALYHDAAKSEALAAAVIDGALRGLGLAAPEATIVGPPGGALRAESERRGAAYAREGFADRGYREDGSLVPRRAPGALLTDPAAAARQALALARAGTFETLCVHGDTEGAVAVATRVRAALVEAGLLGALRVTAYGEGAVLVDLGVEDAPDRAARTHAVAAAFAAAWPHADVVVGAGTVMVVGVPREEVQRVAEAAPRAAARDGAREHVIAAVYDGPDLSAVAEALGIAEADVIARHAGASYVVELVGFLPGFAYLTAQGGAPLPVPRRASPRPKVPAGSVAVAAAFTGIYPFASPGGWNLIGRALDAAPFDAGREPAVRFAPGDRVRFVAAAGGGETPPPAPPRTRGGEGIGAGAGAALAIVAAPACATVQDRGRIGQLGRGIPPSGPLDPETFAAANAAAGNAAGAAAIEVPLGSIEVEARGGAVVVSVDGEAAVEIPAGERLRVAAGARAVRYLAVRGGVDVPLVLGARATLLAAGIGGLAGRPLRKGDVLGVGFVTAGPPSVPASIADVETLVVDPGPHLGRFPAGAYDVLLGTAWQVSRMGDRVGVRLEGARIPRDRPDFALPVPMLRGAVEVTTDGTPIVLGPDHPTTGGYPVLAVLRPAAQAALARRKPGDTVRLTSDGARWRPGPRR